MWVCVQNRVWPKIKVDSVPDPLSWLSRVHYVITERERERNSGPPQGSNLGPDTPVSLFTFFVRKKHPSLTYSFIPFFQTLLKLPYSSSYQGGFFRTDIPFLTPLKTDLGHILTAFHLRFPIIVSVFLLTFIPFISSFSNISFIFRDFILILCSSYSNFLNPFSNYIFIILRLCSFG